MVISYHTFYAMLFLHTMLSSNTVNTFISLHARVPENLLWNIERIVANIFIPILNSATPGRGEDLQNKVMMMMIDDDESVFNIISKLYM